MTRCKVTESEIKITDPLSKSISKTWAILTYIVILHLCPKSQDAGFKCCLVEHFLELFIIMEQIPYFLRWHTQQCFSCLLETGGPLVSWEVSQAQLFTHHYTMLMEIADFFKIIYIYCVYIKYTSDKSQCWEQYLYKSLTLFISLLITNHTNFSAYFFPVPSVLASYPITYYCISILKSLLYVS